MQINLNPTSERGASRDAVTRSRETLGDSHLISSDPRSRFGLVCDLLCCRGNIETQLVNLGRGTAQKLSCGVYPNQFVVGPLHALSPLVGAHLRLECDPVPRSAPIRNGDPRIPPSSPQPHARPRARESSAGSEKNLRSGSPALSQLSLGEGPGSASVPSGSPDPVAGTGAPVLGNEPSQLSPESTSYQPLRDVLGAVWSPGRGSLSSGKRRKTRCIGEADVRRTGEKTRRGGARNCGELA